MRHEWAHCHYEAANQLAHSCGLLNHPNSFRGGMFELNAKFDADSLLYSVILNAVATQYTCSGYCMYCAHTDQYSEVVLVHTCTFQSTLLGCQVTSMLCKLFSLYYQWLDFFWTCCMFIYKVKKKAFGSDEMLLYVCYSHCMCSELRLWLFKKLLL